MSSGAKKVEVEQRANIETVVLPILVTIDCHTTDASISCRTDIPSIVKIYTETDGLTPPSDASFPTLDDDAAPGVFGLYATVGNAYKVCSVVAGNITNGGTLAMTGMVPSFEGDVAASPGVTSSKNISLGLSCTGLDPDSEIATCSFWVTITYLKDMRQAS